MKKIICLILALCLVLSTCVFVFADEEEDGESSYVGEVLVGAPYGNYIHIPSNSYMFGAETIATNHVRFRRAAYNNYTTSDYIRLGKLFTTSTSDTHVVSMTIGGHSCRTGDLSVGFNLGNLGEVVSLTPHFGCYESSGRIFCDSNANFEFNVILNMPETLLNGTSFATISHTNVSDWFDVWIAELLVDGVTFIGSTAPEPEPEPEPHSQWFRYEIPVGSAVHFETVNGVGAILKYVSNTGNIGSYFAKPNFDQFLYNTSGDIGTSINGSVVPLERSSSKGPLGGASEFIHQVNIEATNTLNVWNTNTSERTKYGTFSVEIYADAIARMVVRTPDGVSNEILGNFNNEDSSGDTTTIGGSGTASDPYNLVPLDSSGNVVDTSSIGYMSPDYNPNADLGNTLGELFNRVFAVPLNAIETITNSMSNFGMIVQGLFSAFPVEITSLIVSFFSIVILVGVFKTLL